MPQVTVYIREDDLDAWKAVEKKSEFLHQALNGELNRNYGPHLKLPPVKKRPSVKKAVDLESLKDKIGAVCTGHDIKRWDCGRKGCQYA